ncbi:hypothetical protein ACFWAR_04085 [Streptomyces sp. NPDC059917]|uniref:hypothetical protein n=1 Tax=Streptomyces sp. NPDC059917 TaxID=3347002 RepID=UPI003659A6AC
MDAHTDAGEGASAVLAAGPAAVFRWLLDDEDRGGARPPDEQGPVEQGPVEEGPADPRGARRATTALVARRILDAFLSAPTGVPGPGTGEANADADADGEAIADRVRAERGALEPLLRDLIGRGRATRRLVLRQRAPLLLPGCARRRGPALVGLGVRLPAPGAPEFLRRSQARPLTLLHAAFHLALARLPGPFLPEVVGAHYAMSALGADALLLGTDDPGDEPRARTVLVDYLALTEHAPDGERDRRRLTAAVALVLRLEREHAALLGELADWHAGLAPDARVARILLRHAPCLPGPELRGSELPGPELRGSELRRSELRGSELRGPDSRRPELWSPGSRDTASRSPGSVGPDVRRPDLRRLDVRRLPEWLDDEDHELTSLVEAFRRSSTTGPAAGTAPDFGRPLFELLDEDEAEHFARWGETVAAGGPAGLARQPNPVGDAAALVWARRIANVERFPHLRSSPDPVPASASASASAPGLDPDPDPDLISPCR